MIFINKWEKKEQSKAQGQKMLLHAFLRTLSQNILNNSERNCLCDSPLHLYPQELAEQNFFLPPSWLISHINHWQWTRGSICPLEFRKHLPEFCRILQCLYFPQDFAVFPYKGIFPQVFLCFPQKNSDKFHSPVEVFQPRKQGGGREKRIMKKYRKYQDDSGPRCIIWRIMKLISYPNVWEDICKPLTEIKHAACLCTSAKQSILQVLIFVKWRNSCVLKLPELPHPLF